MDSRQESRVAGQAQAAGGSAASRYLGRCRPRRPAARRRRPRDARKTSLALPPGAGSRRPMLHEPQVVADAAGKRTQLVVVGRAGAWEDVQGLTSPSERGRGRPLAGDR